MGMTSPPSPIAAQIPVIQRSSPWLLRRGEPSSPSIPISARWCFVMGVLRLKAASAAALAERASALIAAHGDELEAGAFVTDDGDGVRVRRH
ncbi:MAG TPA: hypothetical protein PKY87_05165 [Terricaulis sp.]|nr:hypothetical protein [Terricaulis sp.]